jgi:hypothetical protein
VGPERSLAEPPATSDSPYVGPQAFSRGQRLYGRDRELRQLLNLLIAERIVLLYSPSGAGKTSLIQAALVPALEQEGLTVRPVARVIDPAVLAGRDRSGGNPYVAAVLARLASGPSRESQPNQAPAGPNLAQYLGK